jgi:hypothetical protein
MAFRLRDANRRLNRGLKTIPRSRRSWPFTLMGLGLATVLVPFYSGALVVGSLLFALGLVFGVRVYREAWRRATPGGPADFLLPPLV